MLPFQSTLPRGSDWADGVFSKGTKISIHAPSRERHYELTLACPAVEISIHAPSRERPIIDRFDDYCYLISIHAPSRERLTRSSCISTSTINFNPRSLAGATRGEIKLYVENIGISIHAPSRERRNTRTKHMSYHYFNPRSLAGATVYDAAQFHCASISIHAPSRERPNALAGHWSAKKFQSTLPRGSDWRSFKLTILL